MAEDRKARLAALAAKSGRNIPSSQDQAQSTSDGPKLSFRNYVPKDASLQESQQPNAKRIKTETSALEKALAAAQKNQSSQSTGASTWSAVTAVETKKVNWDLKRDIADRMEKLDKRTQRAIVDMLRERLEKEADEDGDGSDLD